jgi:imidazolonepropionase-like amidohydrolase
MNVPASGSSSTKPKSPATEFVDVEPITAILAKAVIDGTGREPIADASVGIQRGRIVWIGRMPTGAAPIHVADCREWTLMPGFVDAHQHLCFSAGPDNEAVIGALQTEDDSQLALRALANARDALRGGVTTIRDCGGRGLVTLRVRDAIDSGRFIGPRILASGMPITTTMGHCWFCGLIADGADAARQAAEAMCDAGADFVKVMGSGGMMTATSDPLKPQYDLAAMRGIVDVAHNRGLAVASHVLNTEAIRYAVEAGVDTLEHCLFQTPDGKMEPDGRLIQEMLRQRIYVGSTMGGIIRQKLPADGDAPEVRAEKLAWLRERFAGERVVREAGVPVMLHTDAGVRMTPHREFAQALVCGVVALGMTPLEAITAATKIPALGIGLGDEVGTIEVAQRADLIAVEGDPSSNVGDAARVRRVWRDGRLIVSDGQVLDGAAA